MSTVILCNDETLKGETGEGLVLVDFMADWCSPCKQVMPILDELAADKSLNAKIVKVNVDQSPISTKEFGVRGIPALFIVSNGEVVQRFVGVQSKDALMKALSSHV